MRLYFTSLSKQKENGQTTPFSVDLTTSLSIYQAAQQGGGKTRKISPASHLIGSRLSLQEGTDLCRVFGAEVHLLPALRHKGHVALQGIRQRPGRGTEALHLALLGELAQVQQGQVGQLGEGDAARPLAQVVCQQLKHLHMTQHADTSEQCLQVITAQYF